MKLSFRIAPLVAINLAFALGVAGCHGNSDQNAANPDQVNAQNDQDPADANLAPASDTSSTAAPATSAPAASAPASAPQAAAPAQPASDSYDATPEDSGEQPVASAPQPPPPLPEYNQPPCPGDGYIWTPGYWGYAPTGYYWVPGVWTQAPYVGALWTPPYWGYSRGVYALFPGHWGLHIGYYGGINYGFGYIGVGYHGGYWNGGHFNYNRTVNNINVNVVHNVYTYNIVNRVTNVTRVSYNGGPAGIRVRPQPREIVAVREPRAPVMSTQVRHEQTARADRTQFEAVNHGRPATPAFEKPLEADRDVHPAPRPEARPEMHPQPQGHAVKPEPRRPPAHPEEKHK